MRLLILAALCSAAPALAQEHELPPAEEQALICIDASLPVVPAPAAELAARMAAFELPRNLSVQQFERLQQTARHFAAGRERQALQHFAQAVTTAYAAVGSLEDADIEALAFIVLMEAAKSAAEDLRAIMAEVKAINEQKQSVRDHLNTLDDIMADGCDDDDAANSDVVEVVDTCPETLAAIAARIEELRSQYDSLSELGEEQQLKLQMYMDRRSKTLSALSNIMKKLSDTGSQIVQNLK